MVSSIGNEIPSSLDLRPLGVRIGNMEKLAAMSKPNPKFAQVTSKIDHGKKEQKQIGEHELNKVVRMKGENYGRIASKVMAQYIFNGQTALRHAQQLNDI